MELIEDCIGRIAPPDGRAMEDARKRQDQLTKPRGSLGVLEELSVKLAGITGRLDPPLEEKVIFTMAGDHGVALEGVSAYPREVTPQMVLNFLNGGAGINVLARHVGAEVEVVDMGVDFEFEPGLGVIDKKVARGTRNMTEGPAMTREQAARAVEAGIEVVEERLGRGLELAGTGDMGIGNTTPSAAIAAAMTGAGVEEVTGRGTGIDDAAFRRKVAVIEKALEVNRPDPSDPLDVLAKVGGFEIGGIAGAILGCAANRIPVVIDGFISGAAALIATGLAPQAKDYIIPAHCSVEAGHRLVLEHMGLRPLLDLDMRLGEGTGAALGMGIVEAAVKVLNEMATFEEAGVTDRE
ncbi:MAG: nicotinate-nucleotide--dimethylbenzimidazole phosphoribosyltransferase [Euryarchaeota archaeon]|nr:nicotinate-nucleotide--dimethylbenzimidazole phosphoribosyltransferase [Euryarchaeota archaeon]